MERPIRQIQRRLQCLCASPPSFPVEQPQSSGRPGSVMPATTSNSRVDCASSLTPSLQNAAHL